MRKQLQHTTIVVLILLVALAGALYAIDNTSFGADNQLTAATVTTTVVECDIPLEKDASSLEKKHYDEQCNS